MNRLIHESSPYLLQHAHNPVNWYPWSEEAFERAVAEDKPVLVSIGYAACHWCHVMERESFEKEEVAAIMNAHFINIKVDREERPDVDHIYMDALQAISGSGGWPLNVFLLPDKKPFYGGTYFPPVRAFNRAAWTEVLLSVAAAYRERKPELEAQADNLTQHLEVSNAFSAAGNNATDAFHAGNIDMAFAAIMKTADRQWGGFGKAPKFPQTFTIGFLLRYAHLTGNNEARQQALLSLDKMMEGGIYDHIGGGFARYSTDAEWLAPHFEKMLYDNALIAITLADAYALTGEAKYRKVLEETLAFTERELCHGEGGFFSALDADSEGVEGKFYVWQKSEMDELLGEDAALFCEYYDITEGGNWEHTNILRTLKPLPLFAKEKGLEEAVLEKRFESAKIKLLNAREGRIRPGLDDKIILGWNALMNTAFSRAYAVTGRKRYLEVARKNMHFLLTRFSAGNDRFYHTWKDGKAKYPAFLDDYSHLIAALITLAQAAADYSYLDEAALLTGVVIEGFSDEDSTHFFYTGKDQKDILLRKKELFDGATPSGNAVMAQNLHHLSVLFDKGEWRQKSENAVKSIAEAAIRYPTSFGVWVTALHQIITGTPEITIAGPAWQDRLQEVQALFLPYGLIMAAEKPNAAYPLLKDKETGDETLIFLCRHYTCRQPVKQTGQLRDLLKAV